MSAKKSNPLARVFAPKDVGLNRDTDLLKFVAMFCMLVDHTGKMFFSQHQIMRIVGRLAFPIFAYCIAVGGVYSKNRMRYLSRIMLVGLVSQPFYAMALNHTVTSMFRIRFADNPVRAVFNFYVQSWAVPNIMLTLALGLLIIWSLREGEYVAALAVMLVTWKIQSSVNYGWRGVALIVLFYLFIEYWWLSLPAVFAFMAWWGMTGAGFTLFGIRFGIQMFALLALPLIYIPTRSRIRINKWVFYMFYPAHLIGIILIRFALAMGK